MTELLLPENLTGKEWEETILSQAKRLEKQGLLTAARYGVKGSFIGGEWRPVQSLPDFDMVFRGGRQAVCEAKVTKTVRMPLSKQQVKPVQIHFMLQKAAFGVPSFLLVFHSSRALKAGNSLPHVKAYPVHQEASWIPQYLADVAEHGTGKGSIPSEDGFNIPWIKLGKARHGGPDLLAAIEASTFDRS